MPRHRRIFIPHIPLHIVQRGHDRQPIFIEPNDYRLYLDNLAEQKTERNIKLFGYCLMTNHVHLIVSPDEPADAVSDLMRTLAARQTRHVNKLERRSGTLWEGRFKASLIDSNSYLLACQRYVDLNPVRASMTTSPSDYQWSSYRGLSGKNHPRWLDKSPAYTALGKNNSERAEAYRAFVSEGIPDRELSQIRAAVQRNQVTGGDKFRRRIEKRIGRRISKRAQGRPRKEK